MISPAIVLLLLEGLTTTVFATTLIVMFALPCALVGGLGRLSAVTPVRWLAGTYIEFFRGSSAIVQLFWAFFVLPDLGLTLSPLQVGVGVLALNAGAYGSEIVKGAVLGVPRGQWEAAIALNMSPLLRMRKVILPQALPVILPSFGNLMIGILQGTSILSLITVTDLTRITTQLILSGILSVPVAYGGLLVSYFIMALPLIYLVRRGERFSRRYVEGLARSG